MHTCTCVCVYIYIYVCTYVCTYVRMYARMHGCMFVCTYVCIYACMHVCMYEGMYAYNHTYIFIYVFAHTYGSASKQGFVAVPPTLLQTFVAALCFKPLSRALCLKYCSLQQACRREGLSQDPSILLQALSQKAGRACYMPDVFEALPYMYITHGPMRLYSLIPGRCLHHASDCYINPVDHKGCGWRASSMSACLAKALMTVLKPHVQHTSCKGP